MTLHSRLGEPIVAPAAPVLETLKRLRSAVEQLETTQRDLLRQRDDLLLSVRLTAAVAHDLNNLWSIVGSSAQFLLGSLPAASPLHRDAERVKQCVDRGAGLGRQLVEIGQGKPNEPQSLDLTQILREMAPLLSVLLGEQIGLRFETRPGLWSVRADPVQIERAIINLVANAKDAIRGARNGARAGTVAVATANVESGLAAELPKPGAYVMVEVTDTGCGMNAQVRRRIFHSSFTTKRFGTGLGLLSVGSIVEQYGGYISCTSQPGRGTTFRIYLPREKGETSVRAPRHRAGRRMRTTGGKDSDVMAVAASG